MRIVYGGPEASEMGMTYADALDKVCDGGHLRVAVPYIAPDRLHELMKRSTRFSIITDLSACFGVLSSDERTKMTSLITDHAAAFRHVPELHAKVVFSQSKLLLGSANLTGKGLEQRDELGAFFHEATQLAEAREWFEALWRRGRVIHADELRTWAAKLPAYQPMVVPPFGGKTARAQQKVTPVPAPSRGQTPLDDILSLAPSKEALTRYLGLIRWAYHELVDGAADPRMGVSIYEKKRIHLSINNRWVLQHSEDYSTIGFLLSSVEAARLERRPHESVWQFDQRGSDRGDAPPCLLRVRGYALLNEERVRKSFREAMRKELLKGRSASNRKFHRPDLLELILDEQRLDRHLRALKMS